MYKSGATRGQRLLAALEALARAIRLRDASVQIESAGTGSNVPSFAALSASSLPGIFRWPGTHRMQTAPGRVWGNRALSGHLRATSRNLSKTDCEEPVEWPRSLVATSRLSRQTHRSVANRADGRLRAVSAPWRAAIASASKTSALRPRDRV